MGAHLELRILISFFTFYFVSAGDLYVGEELYVGCYKHVRADLNVELPLNECITKCYYKHFYFAGIKGLSGCFCGNKIDRRVSSSKCKKSENYAVYTVLPAYMGCFKDDADRDLDILDAYMPSLTTQSCVERCVLRNATYAGTQLGNHCLCGNRFGKHGSSIDIACNRPCEGNVKEYCGSKSKNSIYSVNHAPGLRLTYDQIFHCAKKTDVFGYCAYGKCKPGWKGPKCNQRDCSVLNGHCGGHKCVEHDVRGSTISECVCKKGFSSHSLYHNCEDIDECTVAHCPNEEDLCVNSFGSYVCSKYEAPHAASKALFHPNALPRKHFGEEDMPEY